MFVVVLLHCKAQISVGRNVHQPRLSENSVKKSDRKEDQEDFKTRLIWSLFEVAPNDGNEKCGDCLFYSLIFFDIVKKNAGTEGQYKTRSYSRLSHLPSYIFRYQ